MMREVCDAGGAIFFSTHVLEVAEKLCDKVAIIKSGKLICSGIMDDEIQVDYLGKTEEENSESSSENEDYPGEDVVEIINLRGETTTVYKLVDGRYMNRTNTVYIYDGNYTFPSEGLPAGSYFVEVYGRGSTAGQQYGITPKCTYVSNWETESNDDYTSADPLSMGVTRYGTCIRVDYSNDDDWYKFVLNSSSRVSVTFTHTKASADGRWTVYLYKYVGNGECSQVVCKDVYVSDGNYTFPTQGLSAGTYFVEVYGRDSACGRQYGVTVNYAVGKPGKFRVSSRGSNSLKLAWNKPAGATGYQLQRKSGNSYKTLATVKGTSYTHKSLTAGAGYTYRVRAYRTVGGKNYYSGWAYMTAYTKPATPNLTGLSATKSGHKIKATWKKVGGSASGYQIYWAKDKNFKKMVSKTTVSGQKKTSYTGKNFTKGKRYYVKVRAYKTVNGNKIYGAWSNVRNVKAK